MTTSITVLTTDWPTLNPGGGAALPAGLPIILRPNAEGTWTGVLPERIPGVVYWWQRAITPTTNAPVPTFGDGYLDGDMVDPLNEGETLPMQGILWSDSMGTSTNDNLAGRAIDNQLGGTLDAAWTVEKFDAAANGRARCMSGIGIDLYDTAIAYPSPSPSLVDNYKVSIDLLCTGTGYYGGLNIRGDSLTDRTLGLWCRGTGTGTVDWSIRGWAPEDWQPIVQLGSTPYVDYDQAVFTVQGDQVSITHGGTTLTHTLSAANDAMTKQTALGAGRYGEFKGRNIIFEAI